MKLSKLFVEIVEMKCCCFSFNAVVAMSRKNKYHFVTFLFIGEQAGWTSGTIVIRFVDDEFPRQNSGFGFQFFLKSLTESNMRQQQQENWRGLNKKLHVGEWNEE